MRISLIGLVYPFRGGIAHSHSRLAQAIEQSGHTLQVVSFRNQYPAWLYPGQSDRDPGQNRIPLPVRYLLDPLYPWTWEKTIREIRAFQPDLVLIQWWTVFWAPALAWIAGRLHHQGLITAYFIHNVLPHEAHRLDPSLARLALKQADAYITLTEREHQRLLALFPGLAKPILTSSLPVYQFATSSTLSKDEARAKLGLPVSDPVILFFGLVRPYKGLSYLVEAFGQLVDDPSRPFLAIVGEFWEDPQIYKDQILRLGIENRVRIENHYLPDEEAVLWFLAADLFIAPYIGGTQSASLRLALGYGLPVIATDVITQELTDLKPAFLTIVPAANAKALAKAIEKRLANSAQPADKGIAKDQWAEMVEKIALFHNQIVKL